MDFGPPQQHWEQWGWDGDSLLADPSGPSSQTSDVYKMTAYSSLSLPNLPLESDPELQSTRPDGSRGTEEFWNSSPFEFQTAGDDTCPNLLAGRVPCDCTRHDTELLNKLQCRRPDIFATLSTSNCQIQGCGADVSLFTGYHQRHRVCDEHAKAISVVHEGLGQRYCQQCGRFHPLTDFDEGKRSCRRKLERHNSRRRRKKEEARKTESRGAEAELSPAARGMSRVEILPLHARLSDQPGPRTGFQHSLETFAKKQRVEMSSRHSGPRIDTATPHSPPEIEASPSPKEASHSPYPPLIPPEDPAGSHSLPPGSPPHPQTRLSGSAHSTTVVFPTIPTCGHLSSPPTLLAAERGDHSPSLLDLLLSDARQNEGMGLHWQAQDASCQPPMPPPYVSQTPTGRVSFKLYDWNPGDFPRDLRNQVLTWLSHMPSGLEGFIRPGCTRLSLYLPMPPSAWTELSVCFGTSVEALVTGEKQSFFGSGTMEVRSHDDQLARVEHGRVTALSRPTGGEVPRLERLRPLCLAGGQSGRVRIRGRHLAAPGSRVVCAVGGRSIPSQLEGARPASPDVCGGDGQERVGGEGEEEEEEEVWVELTVGEEEFMGIGRFEVERGGSCSNYLPILIASPAICAEVRTLERESEGQRTRQSRRERERAAAALIEDLGWLLKKGRALPRRRAGEKEREKERNGRGAPLAEAEGERSRAGSEAGRAVNGWEADSGRVRAVLQAATSRGWTAVTRMIVEIGLGLEEGMGIRQKGPEAVVQRQYSLAEVRVRVQTPHAVAQSGPSLEAHGYKERSAKLPFGSCGSGADVGVTIEESPYRVDGKLGEGVKARLEGLVKEFLFQNYRMGGKGGQDCYAKREGVGGVKMMRELGETTRIEHRVGPNVVLTLVGVGMVCASACVLIAHPEQASLMSMSFRRCLESLTGYNV